MSFMQSRARTKIEYRVTARYVICVGCAKHVLEADLRKHEANCEDRVRQLALPERGLIGAGAGEAPPEQIAQALAARSRVAIEYARATRSKVIAHVAQLGVARCGDPQDWRIVRPVVSLLDALTFNLRPRNLMQRGGTQKAVATTLVVQELMLDSFLRGAACSTKPTRSQFVAPWEAGNEIAAELDLHEPTSLKASVRNCDRCGAISRHADKTACGCTLLSCDLCRSRFDFDWWLDRSARIHLDIGGRYSHTSAVIACGVSGTGRAKMASRNCARREIEPDQSTMLLDAPSKT